MTTQTAEAPDFVESFSPSTHPGCTSGKGGSTLYAGFVYFWRSPNRGIPGTWVKTSTIEQSDLKQGDYFLSLGGRDPVAFRFGEVETRDGKQPDGCTRLWDGTIFNPFTQPTRILVVSKEEAIASATCGNCNRIFFV